VGAWRGSGDGGGGGVGMLAACSLGAAAKAAMVEGEEGGWWQGAGARTKGRRQDDCSHPTIPSTPARTNDQDHPLSYHVQPAYIARLAPVVTMNTFCIRSTRETAP
jgi:hypothetical protein